MNIMKNLITENDLRKPGYKTKSDHYNIDVSISSTGLICILANLDNNYFEWVSLSEITSSKEAIGECVNNIITHSPNGKHASWIHNILKRENIDPYDYKYLWVSTKISKLDSLFFYCNGDEVELLSEKIGARIVEFYNCQLNECKILEDEKTSIRDYLSNLCIQLEQCSNSEPWLAYKRSKEIENPIGFEKLKCLGLSNNKEVQNKYREYRVLLEDIYQTYMNAER